MNKPLDIEEIYDGVLKGTIPKFPRGTWLPHKGGYDNFRRCFKLLIIDKLKFSRQELIDNISDKFLQKWKLYGAMEVLFGYRAYDAITYVFPDFDIKIWELKHSPKGWITDETIIESVRWLFNEKLKYDREQIIKNANAKLFESNGLATVYSSFDKYCSSKFENYGVFELLSFCFPEYQFKKIEFKNLEWTNKEKVETIKEFIENVLGYKRYDEIVNNIRFIQFVENGCANLLAFYDNSLFNLLNNVYPEYNWDLINVRRSESRIENLRTK